MATHHKQQDRMNAAEFQEWWKKREAAKDSKYGAIPTQTADGSKFKSELEATYYNRALVLQQAGEILLIEQVVRFELVVNGYFVCEYELDFRITYADGRVEHVDVKSKPTVTPLYRLKKKLMFACHGITLVEWYGK